MRQPLFLALLALAGAALGPMPADATTRHGCEVRLAPQGGFWIKVDPSCEFDLERGSDSTPAARPAAPRTRTDSIRDGSDEHGKPAAPRGESGDVPPELPGGEGGGVPPEMPRNDDMPVDPAPDEQGNDRERPGMGEIPVETPIESSPPDLDFQERPGRP